MAQPRILAFAGSARKDSLNKKLIGAAAASAQQAGAQVTLIDLASYDMPIYDGDLEQTDGVPDNAHKLKALFKSHDGLLISSPEYNSSISPLLKNVIDWVSRPVEGESQLECFKGKTAGLIAASPGALGGLRGLVHVRAILGNIGVHVIPDQRAVSKAHEAFNDDGTLKDEQTAQGIEQVAKALVHATAALHSN